MNEISEPQDDWLQRRWKRHRAYLSKKKIHEQVFTYLGVLWMLGLIFWAIFYLICLQTQGDPQRRQALFYATLRSLGIVTAALTLFLIAAGILGVEV